MATEYFFRASPFGKLVGMQTIGEGQSVLQVVVVPKTWHNFSGSSRVIFTTNSMCHIVVTEGARFSVVCDDLTTNLAMQKLTRVFPIENSEQLLAIESIRVTHDLITTFGNSDETGSTELLALLSCLDCNLDIIEIEGFIPTGASKNAMSLILNRCFVNEVERQIKNIKPTYRWVSESISVVRGRVNSQSIAVSTLSKNPKLLCTFEEFGLQSPTLSVIAAGLDAVVADAGLVLSEFARATRQKASKLRRYLMGVDVYSRSHAIHESTKIGDVPNHFIEAFRLSKMVLSRNLIGNSNLARNSFSLAFAVNTASLWESYIFKILSKTNNLKVREVNKVGLPSELVINRPWIGLGTMNLRPDLVLENQQGVFLVDAKYKQLEIGPVSISDQYQMFAYSVLANQTREGWNGSVDLVFCSDTRSSWSIASYSRGDSGLGKLTVHKVEFPRGPKSMTDWNNFLENQAQIASSYWDLPSLTKIP